MRWVDRLFRRLLPGDLGEAVTGDLWEEYHARLGAGRGALRTRCWFLAQVVASVPAAFGLRRRAARTGVPGIRTGGGGAREALGQDLRYALRGLRARPAFTAVALVTLALGIGANTAIFSVVDAVVLRPLPYDDPDRLVRVWPDLLFPFELTTALAFEEQAGAYEELSFFGRGLFTLVGDGEPELVRGAVVQANHFAMLGVRPALGRGFLPEEGTGTGARVAVLSHGLWERRFGADPAVVGTSVRIGSELHTVVGVTAPDHQPLESDWQLWVPLRVTEDALTSGRALALNGRLRPGVSPADAQAESRRLRRDYVEANGGTVDEEDVAGLRVVPLQEWMVGETASRLTVLLGAVAFVLLIASANVANLLLALGGSRARELAVRRALGAGRGRVVRQLLTEAAVLGLLGGALGVGLAYGALSLGAPHLPADLPRAHAIAIDGRVLLFSLVLAMASALLFGIAPALRATRRDVASTLREGVKGSADGRQLRLNHGLVAAEVALAVVLVAGSGLMLKSFWTLTRVDPGFEAEGVLTLRVAPPASYATGEEVQAFHVQVEQAIGAVPGVEEVGAIQFLPMRPGGWWSRFAAEGEPPPRDDQASLAMRVVTPDYFEAMGIDVIRGRAFDAGLDRAETDPVVLVNQTLAEHAWPGRDPVGRNLLIGVDEPAPYRVVGLVRDVRQAELQTASHPEAYVPLAQRPWQSLFYAVRVDGDPAAAAGAVRAAVWSVHDGAPISSVSPLADVVGATVSGARLFTGLLTGFGALALVLGAVGVYGLMSYVVSLRSREIGIRMAMGAASQRVMAATVLRGMAPVAVGLAVGLLAALAGGRVLATALYEVEPGDPSTLGAVTLVLAVSALAALYVPARRASRLDPMRVLRED